MTRLSLFSYLPLLKVGSYPPTEIGEGCLSFLMMTFQRDIERIYNSKSSKVNALRKAEVKG